MEVLQVIRVEEDVPVAYSGDNVKLRLKGVEEDVCLKRITSLQEIVCII